MKSLILLAILFLGAVNASTKCHCLAISGGGSLGSYEAGVFRGLVKNLEPYDRSYDVVSGVSAGSINSFVIALFDIGKELEAADYLCDLYANIQRTDIFQDWPFGIIQGLISESGLFTTKGFISLMKEKVKELGVKEMKRGILLGITDANTGDYVVVDEHNTPDKMAEYVAASCSIPALFEDIKMDDTVYIDGGVLINLNAASAIQKCKDMGYEEKDIVMDLIFAHEKHIEQEHLEEATTLKILLRYLALDKYMKSMFYVEEEMRAFPDVDWRFMVMPSHKMKGDLIPLDFSHESMAYNIEHGEADGAKAVKDRQNVKDVVAKLRQEILSKYMNDAKTFNKVK